MEIIQEKNKEEEEENKQEFEEGRIEEWNKNKMGNLRDLYDEL